LFRYILSSEELASAEKRIAQVVRMDLIGQAVAKGVADIDSQIAQASGIR
jgi:hypothetical protein